MLPRNRISCLRMTLTVLVLTAIFVLLYYWANVSAGSEWSDLPQEMRRQAGAILSGMGRDESLLDDDRDLGGRGGAEGTTDAVQSTTVLGSTESPFAAGGPLAFLAGLDEDDEEDDDAELRVDNLEKEMADFEDSLAEWETEHLEVGKGEGNSWKSDDLGTLAEDSGAVIGFQGDDDLEDELGLLEDTGPIGLPGEGDQTGFVGVGDRDRMRLQEEEEEDIGGEGWADLGAVEAGGSDWREERRKGMDRRQDEAEDEDLEEDYDDVDEDDEDEDEETTTSGTSTMATTTAVFTTTEGGGDEEDPGRNRAVDQEAKAREKAKKKAIKEAKKKKKEDQKTITEQNEIDAMRRDERRAMMEELNAAPVSRFKQALEQYSNKDKRIVLLLSDSRYTLLTLNFYETSVIKLGLRNVLFCTMDRVLCSKLTALNIPCVFYDRLDEEIRLKYPSYGPDIFQYKVFYKIRMMFEAVALGYTVFYSDVDTILMRNPFRDIEKQCQGQCDVALPIKDREKRHVGLSLAYARPTENSVYFLYDLMHKMLNNSMKIPQRWLFKLRRVDRLNLLLLGMNKYPHGKEFFSTRKFANVEPCENCVAVINDEHFTKDAKTYRFKEMHFWNLNVEGYYSDLTRKYIVYDNPYTFTNETETLIAELKALRNALALGQILRRVVVLPRFHCFVQEDIDHDVGFCNLHDVLRLEEFHREFMGRYREHTFLSHVKVPTPVKESLSPAYFIGSSPPADLGPDREITGKDVVLVKPRSPALGADSNEIRNFFEKDEANVLRFHSLYNVFSHFWSDDIARDFNRRLKKGFAYRKRVKYNLRKLRVLKPEPKWAGGGPGGGGQISDVEKLKAMIDSSKAE